jgi:hypothetical protein
MTMKTSSFVAAAAFLALSACVTPTPYQPKDSSGYGFSEHKLEANRYRIVFKGNSVTDRTQVEDALLYRAAELTLANNYDYFVVATRGTDRNSTMVGEPRFSSPFYYGARFYSPRYGWRPWYDPFWDDPVTFREITRYEASAEIAMFKGAKPAADSRAFNAREVEANLHDRVVPAPQPH